VRLLTARLSARRRSRFAGPVVLLLALLVTGGFYTALSPATAEDAASSTEDVAKGRELFLVGCSSCHGKNGEGILTEDGTWYGPSLVGVGAAAVDFQVGTGRMPMAAPGAQAPIKRQAYNEEETAQLAAFVASLGPGPAIPDPEQYDPSTLSDEEREEAIVRGGEFFRTNCTACHNFAGSGGALPGGKYAPTLIGVEPRHIYEALITGPQQMPVFSDEVLEPSQKKDIIAYEGMFAWVLGIGSLVGFAIWIASHTARSTKKGVHG
jgi:ubiquinol-cytochrome c reductase cytochrome c subunit